MLNNTKVLRQLEDLRLENPDIFLSLKLNINSIHQKLKLRKLEESFLEQKGETYTVYEVHSDMQEIIAQSLNVGCKDARHSLLVVSPDESCAVFYQVGSDFQIFPRANIFGYERITDILETFEGHIDPIVQDISDDYNDPSEEEPFVPVVHDWATMFEEE